jgi:hypothetical protein
MAERKKPGAELIARLRVEAGAHRRCLPECCRSTQGGPDDYDTGTHASGQLVTVG